MGLETKEGGIIFQVSILETKVKKAHFIEIQKNYIRSLLLNS